MITFFLENSGTVRIILLSEAIDHSPIFNLPSQFFQADTYENIALDIIIIRLRHLIP